MAECLTSFSPLSEIGSETFCFGYLKDWQDATQVARAFQIGRLESVAVSHLKERVDPEIVLLLKQAVRSRGMRQFLTHDVIAREFFNLGYTSGASGAFTAWNVELSNNQDGVLAPCL